MAILTAHIYMYIVSVISLPTTTCNYELLQRSLHKAWRLNEHVESNQHFFPRFQGEAGEAGEAPVA